MNLYLYDYHMHSLNSTDGHDKILAMCERAVGQGLREIAITDHFEPSLGNESYQVYDAEKYFFEIAQARRRFEGKLLIKTGVELGQPHLYPKYSLKLTEEFHFDYVLASAHKMANNVDFGEVNYTRENLSIYCLRYLDELRNLALWNRFDCLGHLDLVKRYATINNLKINLLDYKEKLAEILRIVIENGKGIEVNTSGLRQSAKECLPDFDIIRFYKQLGGEIITIGSDAHTADDVGKGVRSAIEMIQCAGFNYMTIYTNRRPFMVKITNKSAAFSIREKLA